MKTTKHVFVIETTEVAADILREILCKALHEGEELSVRWCVENAVDIEHAPKLGRMELFATPESSDALTKYVTQMADGERQVAVTVMGMTWNLCSALMDPNRDE